MRLEINVSSDSIRFEDREYGQYKHMDWFTLHKSLLKVLMNDEMLV